MFILLSQLISQAKLKGMHVMIRPCGEDGKLTVVIACESSDPSSGDANLKAALAQPLCLTGSVTEIENLLVEKLPVFCESYTACSSNLDDVTKGHSSAKPSSKPKTEKVTDSATSENKDDGVEAEHVEDHDPELF